MSQPSMASPLVRPPVALPGIRGIDPEERFNVLSHLLGAGLSGIATLALVLPALGENDLARSVCFCTYGLGVTASFLASAVYHAARGEYRVRLRRHDRSTIFLAMPGCYAPFAVLGMPAVAGLPILAAVSALAVLGARRELRQVAGDPPQSIALYLLMGSALFLASEHLLVTLTPAGLAMMLGGSLVYAAGALVVRFLQIPRSHEIWHTLALFGNACHFAVIFLYLR